VVKIDLIQPRHNYAPHPSVERLGHIYMPTSLLTAGSVLLDAGIDVFIQDENFCPSNVTSRYVGINLLGAPYIPEAIKLQDRIRKESENEAVFFLGGKVVDGLTTEQFTRLFGRDSYKGNDLGEVASQMLGEQIPVKNLLSISLIPTYARITLDMMKEYLSREISFFVSKGCSSVCDFCAADKGMPETYRNQQALKNDLSYLVRQARSFGLDRLSIYMSNLDVFQTPYELKRFAQSVREIKSENSGFEIQLRGLSRVSSFLDARSPANLMDRRSIEDIIGAGFHTVGFGVDGGSTEAWKNNHKGQNEKMCIGAIKSARQDYGLTPETLMVFGHVNVNANDPRAAYDFAKEMQGAYGSIPRPHVSKWRIPGNIGWADSGGESERELLLSNPALFQSLDFTALPSKLTHPDPALRAEATKYFLLMCLLPGNTTQPVLPLELGMDTKEIAHVMGHNLKRWDR
jgi:hypothetical protein